MTATLFKKGAEASLYLDEWHGRRVVIKTRLPKKYRPGQLDFAIRRYRTIHEPQLMHEGKLAGVPTPTILLVDVENTTIIMEYIEGRQVKLLLDGLGKTDREELCRRIGGLIARMHKRGVVHGDLTTSNMILSDNRVFLVDFGLGEKNFEVEAQGVDLHLLKRALQSTHFQHAESCFSAVLKGYAAELGEEGELKILEKMREIEKRGRYVGERKQEA